MTAPEGAGRLWHLPGLDDSDALGRHEGRTAVGAGFHAPALDASAAAAVAGAVRAAAMEARRALGIDQVVRAVSRAGGRLADPEDEVGHRAVALLSEELGWPPALARETLEGMAASWGEGALWALLEEELGDPRVLDGFGAPEEVPPDVVAPRVTGRDGAPPASSPRPPAAEGARGVRRRRAAGPPLMLVVHAGNVPGVAVTAAVRGLLARSGVLSKAAEDEPGLLALFARALAEEDPLLGRCLAVTWWPGRDDAPAWGEWTTAAGTVVVYGGDEAVRAVRGRVPAEAELLAYGPKLGIGVVLPDAAAASAGSGDADRSSAGSGRDTASARAGEAAGEAARALARDVCAYEQQGCVSPRVVYVVDADPLPFARALAAALEEEVERVPRPEADADEAVAVRSLRAEAEFRSYRDDLSGAGGDEGSRAEEARGPRRSTGEGAGASSAPEVLASGGDLSWTLLVGGGDRTPASEALPRVVRVHGVASLEELEGLLEPAEGRIQAVGYAGVQGLEELADAAARLGACRVAPFGTVAWPPADWRHDGRHQLLRLLRWTEWEEAP